MWQQVDAQLSVLARKSAYAVTIELGHRSARTL